MKHTSIFTLIVFQALFFCNSMVAQKSYISPKLQKIWTSQEGSNVPESSCYNAGGHIIYVSSIVGMHNIKDGIGFISKLNEKGEIVTGERGRTINEYH